MYNHDMECQVNVAQDGGERVDGEFKGRRWQAWSDGMQTWKSFRIPYNANTDPKYEDRPISFDLEMHAEGIGMTGWNWADRQSAWVGYDFDAIIGHSERHEKKLTDVELAAVQKAVWDLDWVTVRKSTGGRGLHLYVFLPNVPTSNHNEHAALARAILGKMSALTGFDFHSKVDACGGNMWVWHRKLLKAPEGLKLIKEGGVLQDIPNNWEDHVQVISGRRNRPQPKFVVDQGDGNLEDAFDEVTSRRSAIPIDKQHEKLIRWLEEHKSQWAWDQDSKMLTVHTYDLKQAHEELNFKGIFETVSKGRERGQDWNCASGNTRVITRSGVRTLKEIYDTDGHAELYVWTGDGFEWIDVPIKHHGIRKTYPIRFGNGAIEWATDNHYWLTYNYNTDKPFGPRKMTCQLKADSRRGDTAFMARFELGEPDLEGVAHGFVFGDGWRIEESGLLKRKANCQVKLHGNDIDLRPILEEFGNYSETTDGRYFRQLPEHWKELPIECSQEYALGFVLGFLCADGSMKENGARLTLYQSDYHDLKDIRDLAIYAGFRCNEVRESERDTNFKEGSIEYCFTIQLYNLEPDHFFRSDQRERFEKNLEDRRFKSGTTVVAVGWDEGRIEDVYCPSVSYHHNFTLASGIVTSNCFAFPLLNGGWVIRRFTPGVQEAEPWEQDGQGWTRCFYNVDPDLKTAARHTEGVEDQKGGFNFMDAQSANKAASLLGSDIGLDPKYQGRKTRLSIHKDGRLMVEVDKDDRDDGGDMKGWLPGKKTWMKFLNIRAAAPVETEVANYDDMIRHLVTEADGQDYTTGWTLQGDDIWRLKKKDDIKVFLRGTHSRSGKEVDQILGSAISKPWTVVCKPFQPEFIGGRMWNRNAAQLRFHPKEITEKLDYPTWMKILNHIGRGLDEAIENHKWCQQNGILKGADYLKCWIASLFQEPEQPLPYLFLYSEEQGTGKSIFHEAISLLLTCGVVRADSALINPSGFNGELEGSVIGVIEETDLRTNKQAQERIKDWVTSSTIQIHQKGMTPYSVTNTCHFVHCANSPDFCPIISADTRITMIEVPTLDPVDLIPKKDMIPQLEKEAPDFLAEILNLEVPPPSDRLNVPVIETEIKQAVAISNESFLQIFIRENCFPVDGGLIKWSEFYEKFADWLDPAYRQDWGKIRTGKRMPKQFPKGRVYEKQGQFYIGNIAWEPLQPGSEPSPPLQLVGDQLLPKEVKNEETKTDS
jgi:hypothetical protein